MKTLIFYFLSICILTSCFRTVNNRFELDTVDVISYDLEEYEDGKNCSPFINYQIVETTKSSLSSQSMKLVLFQLNKKFVQGENFEGTVPFSGYHGANDTLFINVENFALDTGSKVYLSNELRKYNLVSVKKGTLHKSTQDLSFDYINSMQSLELIMTHYNKPSKMMEDYYPSEDICFPFIMTNSEFEKLVNSETLTFYSSKRSLKINFQQE